MTIRMALRDLLHHRREARGVLTLVALGTALFVVAMSFVATISTNADRLLFGTIGAPWLVEPATREDVLALEEDDAASLAGAVDADSVRLRLEAAASLAPAGDQADASRPGTAAITLVGVDLDREPALRENLGVSPSDAEDDHVVVHTQVADQLGISAGDDVEVRVGATSEVLTVGHVVTPQLPSFTLETWVVGDRQTLAGLALGDPHGVNQVLVDAPEDARTRAALESAAAGLGGDATVSPWTDTTWSALGLGPQLWAVILLVVLSFTFLVICIGLTSLVYSAILARLRDAAILRTAGMSPGRLRRMFLVETTVQYVAGYVLGAVAASAVILGVNLAGVTSSSAAFTFAVGSTVLSLEPAWWAYAAPFAIGLVLTTVVLWFPIRAISRQPVLDLLELSA